MSMVQTPARDYVPRRSGEIAACRLQAYAFFHHNSYDANGVGFVPGNVLFDAGRLVEVTFACGGSIT
jgi:hypothetical protein